MADVSLYLYLGMEEGESCFCYYLYVYLLYNYIPKLTWHKFNVWR